MDKTGKETLKIMKTVGWYNNWLYLLIKEHLKGEILEIGAGIGNFTNLLAKKGEVTAIDVSSEYIKELKNLHGEIAEIGFGDIEEGKYFFNNKEFDSAVCLNVLEHIKNDNKALKNIYNLLKPGGRFVLLVPAHSFAYGELDKNLGHERRYTIKGAKKKLKSAGFKIKKARYLNWIGLIGWFINNKILRRGVLPKKQLVLFDRIARPLLYLEKLINPPFGLSVFVVCEKVK